MPAVTIAIPSTILDTEPVMKLDKHRSNVSLVSIRMFCLKS